MDEHLNIRQEQEQELKTLVRSQLLQQNSNGATELITTYILNNNYIKTLRNDEKPEIWIYVDGIYVPNGRSYLEEFARTIFMEAYTPFLKNKVVAKVMAETFVDQEDFFANQNNYVNIIPVRNGLLNIETRELSPFSPHMYFFNKLPIFYFPGQDCPSLKKFFREILESEDDFLSVQELFGFALLKEYRYEKAFMLLGNGRNGKGKLIEVLKRFLGHENCANLSLNKIETDGFSLCELQNKLVNISADISKSGLNDTGEFKALTGRDMIHASRKFKTMVKFENYAKMIFAANELPKTSDLTEAFFQRWEIINFPYTFYNQIDYEIHKNDKYAKIRNPNIIQEIASQDEMNGLLNFALDGLDRLQDNKIFSCTKTSEETRDTWIKKSDSSMSFVSEMIVDDVNQFLSWSVIKTLYKDYCRRNNSRQRTDKDLREAIVNQTLATAERRWLDDSQVRGYSGIRLVSEGDSQVNF